jgi:GDP-D-mannose dehydratase
MTKRGLITGVTGQDGNCLTEFLVTKSTRFIDSSNFLSNIDNQ